MNDPQFEVALAKELCPICGKAIDGPIIMNTKLTKQCAEEVKKIHRKVVGFAPKPCKECQEQMTVAFMFIVIDESKSDPANPFRTGEIFGIKKEVAREMLTPEFFEKGAAFIDYQAAKQLGLPSQYQG